MSQLRELIQHLERIAPLELQESYDNSGLLYGDPDWEVRGVLCCLDATEKVIGEALELGWNVIVSHHPPIFRGIKRLLPDDHTARTLTLAIKNDIALYAAHTNLDNKLENGVNQAIASRLGLEGLDILFPRPENPATGTGILGTLPGPLSAADFLNLVRERLLAKVIRHTAPPNRAIHRVAITGGSGAAWIAHARRRQADAYVTADVKYHDFFEADGQLLLCDIGHYESEQFTSELLARLISEKFRTFAAHCTKHSTNPIQYF
ncbi:MAG: Nif3-like dinuclear metal center hexameric protein [Saprospiraceae bacterium]|jgi:dinuclear metal center YbgI/SA1388 family protein|nr:Nif3-like dinuclear metal center hexameric protein [Saprospiraceae bacterium]MBP9210226.1 Nif3-like dinuclear metal center hexameric protein [Saprospiraceae bacterium]MBV6472478.1 GTP cyclohydrolase 1 type 2 [Saprospiraceae bacterium]